MATRYEPIKLADSVRITCNQCLSDMQGLMADIDKAEKAGISGMESMRQRCQACMEQFASIKAEYFPNKK